MRVLTNLLATAIGLWLSYAAVLNFSSLETASWLTYGAAIVVIGLGMWSRTRDFASWPGLTAAAAGLAVIIGFGVYQAGIFNHLATFWILFFAGNIIAVLSLWAAIYPPNDEQKIIRAAQEKSL